MFSERIFPEWRSVAEARSASRLCDRVAAGCGPALTRTFSASAYHSNYSGNVISKNRL
jgi:hypothetical protein